MNMEDIVITDTRRYPDKFHTQLSARCQLLAALRKLPDDEYLAGRKIICNCKYRKGITLTYINVPYTIGGAPRAERSLAWMDKEISEAIRKTNR